MHTRTNFVNPEVITTQGTEKDRNGLKKEKHSFQMLTM